ncbi:MAG: hypothetical protein HZY75_10915 [Nocardioidaceae bacterium]|nr:MAG: hypothetical protein HZY75_10915 [Nocardioidaceae bacterium]
MNPQELTTLLEVALRARAASIEELAKLADRDIDEVRRGVQQLQEWGFLSLTGELITHRRPDLTVSEVSKHLLQTFSQHVDETIARTQHVLDALPALLQAWSLGNSAEHSLPVEVLHGPWAPSDLWHLTFTRSTPAHCDLCMPDTSALFALARDPASLWSGRVGKDLSVRLLLSVADATHPAAQRRVREELDAGVEIRMHPEPPSLFWVSPPDTVGIPLEWGQSWPSSMMAVQSPAIAALLGWVYERLWQEAVPVGDPGRSWDPMLRQMRRGLTMEAAAHSVGLTPRTGRRRVAEAMAHYGVSSHFALGVAWAKEQLDS